MVWAAVPELNTLPLKPLTNPRSSRCIASGRVFHTTSKFGTSNNRLFPTIPFISRASPASTMLAHSSVSSWVRRGWKRWRPRNTLLAEMYNIIKMYLLREISGIHFGILSALVSGYNRYQLRDIYCINFEIFMAL